MDGMAERGMELDLQAASLGFNRPVRVVVPVEVAFNLDKMTKVTRDVLGRLGCPDCHSGWDIRFQLIRDFMVDDKLNVMSIPPVLGSAAGRMGGG